MGNIIKEQNLCERHSFRNKGGWMNLSEGRGFA
jgi:hypothetical protein